MGERARAEGWRGGALVMPRADAARYVARAGGARPDWGRLTQELVLRGEARTREVRMREMRGGL